MRAASGGLALAGGLGLSWIVAEAVKTPGLAWTSAFAFAASCFVALIVVASALRTDLRSSVLWGSLSLVGCALSLQLVDAGKAVRYQHYRPAVGPLTSDDWTIIVGLVAYALTVVAGMVQARDALRSAVSRLGRARTSIAFCVFASVSASPLKDIQGFALEIALSTGLGLVALGAVLLAVVALPDSAVATLERRVDAVLGPADAGGFDRRAFAAASFVIVITSALAYWVWEGHPHISDEITFLFHAKYFAAGSLAAPGVPVPELFDAYQIQCSTTRCLSVLQPGWPGLLSLGVRAGAPWLVNPLVAGLNTVLFFLFVREVYGVRFARGAVLLLAISPWFLFLGMSLMNHQATLLGGLLGVLGTARAIVRRDARWAALAGAGAGLTSLMRPLDGVIVAAVAGLPLLLRGTRRARAAAVLLFAAGTIALGSFNLAYNRAVTGNALEFPVTTYVNDLWGEGTNNLGFGPDRGVYPLWAHMDGFPGHSPFQAIVNAALNVTALQVELFGWAVGSFFPLLILLLWGRPKAPDWLLIGWIVAINALYSLYWFASGPDFAARYWFLAVIPLVILTARGLQELAAKPILGAARSGRSAVAAGVLILAAHSLVVFIPWRSTDKYYRYFGTGPFVREALSQGRWAPGVYLIRGANQPDYAAAMLYAAPDLATGEYVFAYDSLPGSVGLLREAFPGRTIRVMEGPSVTGDLYRVYAVPEAAPPP
jgi:hypothetical protein